MTIQEITKLLDAGFNKEEILALVQDPEPVKDPIPDPVPDPVPDNNHFEDRLSSIEKNIESLIKTIQNQNLLNDHIDTNDQTLEQETDNIMKSIIRPAVKRKDD